MSEKMTVDQLAEELFVRCLFSDDPDSGHFSYKMNPEKQPRQNWIDAAQWVLSEVAPAPESKENAK